MKASVELLTPERVMELWPSLEPYFEEACQSNELSKIEMEAKDIYVWAVAGMAAIFVYFEDDQPACVLGIEFNTVNGHKGANILALAGRSLMQFKMACWDAILEWLRANDVKFLDACTPERTARIFLRRFGFDRSCSYVRMVL